jgi:hypothetical protein
MYEERVSRVPLGEDCSRLGKGQDFFPLTDCRKEFLWVEVVLLDRYDVSRAVGHFVPRDLNYTTTHLASLGALRRLFYTYVR